MLREKYCHTSLEFATLLKYLQTLAAVQISVLKNEIIIKLERYCLKLRI